MRKVIWTLWATITALLLFGFVVVYSASATLKGGAALSTLVMQICASLVGLVFAIVLSHIDYSFWSRRWVVIAVAVISVVSCFAVFCYDPINGSRRWINLLGFSLQPSEFARLGLIIVLSAWFSRIGVKSSTTLKGFFIPALIAGAMILPVFVSPDLGATAVMGVAALTIFLAARVKKRWLGTTILVGIVLASVLVLASPNRRSRVISWIDTLRGVESTEVTSYHSQQALEAFRRGGWKGVGIGDSIQKHQYLPEANSDFVFAIIAEEFGMVATMALLTAYLIILWCGVYIAHHARDRFGRFTALAMTVLIIFEVGFNIGMVIGCLPTKGIALPFMSAGGTSVFATLIACGFILSVAHHSMAFQGAAIMRDSQIDF